MSDLKTTSDPSAFAVGGMRGHIFRRVIHVGMSVLPYVYFHFGDDIAAGLAATKSQVIAAVVSLALLADIIRLRFGVALFGQRSYERGQLSALAWGTFSIGLVFLLVPTKAYAWPLILTLSLGDPFLGELRRAGVASRSVFYWGCLLTTAIWVACSYVFSAPLWLGLLLGPISVAAEWPRLKYVDDNATMVLIPLGLIVLLEPFLKIM